MLLLLALVVVKASHFVIQNAFCQMFDEWGSLTRASQSICIFQNFIHSIQLRYRINMMKYFLNVLFVKYVKCRIKIYPSFGLKNLACSSGSS